ncbi:MAG TPA: hypothetical protein VGD20_12130 [Sphingopyxis sp.]
MAATQVDQPSGLANFFWQACAEGQVSLPSGWEAVDSGTLPRQVKERYGHYSDLKAYAGVSGDRSYLVFAEYTPPIDGVVRRCGVFSSRWNASSAFRGVFPHTHGGDVKSLPPGEFVSSTMPFYSDGFEIRIEDVSAMGMAEIVTFDASTAKELAAKQKAELQKLEEKP